MKTLNGPALILFFLCLVFTSAANAQESMKQEEGALQPSQYDSLPLFSKNLRGRSDHSNWGRAWVAELEQSGIVNRSLRSPYRVAIPLMSVSDAGPKIMITYARRLPGTTEDGVLIFVHIPLP